MDDDQDEMTAPGVLAVPERDWEQALLRSRVIGRLAERDPVSLAAVDEAAVRLGISRRRVYVLLERYRHGSGLVTDLVSGRSDGGSTFAVYGVCGSRRGRVGLSMGWLARG